MLLRIRWVAVLLLALLAACSETQVATEPPPTLMELADTATPQPTSAPAVRPTLPPTWTPTAETPDQAAQIAPTLGVNATFAAILEFPSFEGRCDDFRASPDNPTTVRVGSDIEVGWSPALNVTSYEISLFDSSGSPIIVRRTEATRYTFEAALFAEPNRLYGWTVIPYDEYNTPVCTPRGSEIRAQTG